MGFGETQVNLNELKLQCFAKVKSYFGEELTSSRCQHVTQSTAGLHFTAVGIDVNVADGLLDPNADAQCFSRVCVQNIHKVSVIRRESILLVHALKHRSCWIETYQVKQEEASVKTKSHLHR